MDGNIDRYSLHGACPVKGGGEKWAANLWISNKKVPESAVEEEVIRTRDRMNGVKPPAPKPDDVVPNDAPQVIITFEKRGRFPMFVCLIDFSFDFK